MNLNSQMEVDLNQELNRSLKLRSQIYSVVEDIQSLIDSNTPPTNVKAETGHELETVDTEKVLTSLDFAMNEMTSQEAEREKVAIDCFPSADPRKRTASSSTRDTTNLYQNHADLLQNYGSEE